MQFCDTCHDLFQQLATQHRILLLGRAATTLFGFESPPTDYEIWLEPSTSPAAWTRLLNNYVHHFVYAQFRDPITSAILDLRAAIHCVETLGRLRISGLDVPLLIFRTANEFNHDEFDHVWEQATPLSQHLRVPSLIHLFLNKINTGTPADYQDLIYLEQKVKAHLASRLPFCDEAEATLLLQRYIDPESLRHARANPHPAVRQLAYCHLQKFAQDGDPFSADILHDWDSPL
jgi:hypothetical protein